MIRKRKQNLPESVNVFDAQAVLKKMAQNIDMTYEEVDCVVLRIRAMSTISVPSEWGYAGMLAALADDRDIKNVFDVYATIAEWIADPALANELFNDWNAERLRNQR